MAKFSVRLTDRTNLPIATPLRLRPVRYGWSDAGGPDTAEIALDGMDADLVGALRWLGGNVRIIGEDGVPVWWGIIVEASAVADGMEYGLTLDGMAAGRCAFRLVRSFSVCPSNAQARRRWSQSGFWIGQCSFPGRVFKGMRMAGRMGNDRVTVLSLEVLRVDPERNLLVVKGSVPGHNDSLVIIRNAVKAGAKA